MTMKQKIQWLLAAAFMMLTVSVSAQQYVVSGKVTDADNGQPLIGVAVINPDGDGVVTDENGHYSISASKNTVLTFNTLGYLETTEQVGGRSTVNVALTVDSKVLDEVVVLGYTSQKKNELSSSVVSLSAEKLKDVTTTDLGNLLQGKVAGLLVMNSSGQPGTDADIRIRGTGSISAGAAPLYVVDGVAGGSFNPNDVESLTVLKDASATALYGAAAAGGVIVVTTKSAKTDKTTVTLKASGGVKRALTGRFSPMNSEELYYFQKEIYSKTMFKTLRPKSLLDQDFDWMDAAFRTGSVQDYYVSAAGKAGKLNYFAGLSYYDEKGTLINTGFRKGSARVNLSAPVGSKVKLDLRLNYNRTGTQQASSYVTLEGAYRNLPWDNPYDENTGEILYVDSKVRSDNGKAWYGHDPYNFLHNEQYNYAKSSGEDINADLQLTWNITDWLIFTSTNRFNTSNSTYDEFIDPRTKSPTYSNGYVYNSFARGLGFGTTNLLKAAKDFGDHSINGVIGYEFGLGTYRQMWASGTDMPNGQTALSNAVAKEIGGYDYQTRSWAALAQAQYSYKGRYIITGSVRYDQTSRFAPKARGGWFPGVSAAWLINKESWMQNQNVVSLLKLRGGYGKTGNDNIEDFLWQDSYSLSSQYQGVVAAVLERQQNPNLGWEEAYMASLGIDVSFVPGINVTVDLYDTKNTNLLLAVPQATSTGFFEFMDNVGTVNNRGVELAIDADVLKMKGVVWNVGFNIGFNRNRVTYLPNGEFLQKMSSGISQQVKVGQDIYSWYMPKWLGVNPDNGDPQWEVIEADGTTRATNDYKEATFQVVGKASPLFQGGLSTSLTYKGFSLSANAAFICGNKVFNAARITMDSDGAYSDYNMMSIDNGLGWSRWEEPGDIATHPKPALNGNKSAHGISSRYLEDGSFFRLKNVTFGYNFPKKWIGKARMQGLKLYVSADNIATISRFSGMDPEVRLESTSWELAGTYSTNYPVPFSVVGGIEITF